MKYIKFLDKILNSYKKIGYRPQPKVFINTEEKMCSPLVAIAIAESNDNFNYNIHPIYRWIVKYFKGNWVWVEGFFDAFDRKEPTHWKDSPSQHQNYLLGKKVGTEIRNQLKEIYYKKPNPKE